MVSGNQVRTARAASRAPYADPEPDFWALIDGYEYALHDVATVDTAWAAALRSAAREAWSVFLQTADLTAHLDHETLLEMGFPPLALPLLTNTVGGLPTLFGRFDFLETADGFKLVEFNAETPFFWMETLRINGLACDFHGRRDPNAGCEAAVVETMRTSDIGSRSFAVVASNVYREDFWTAQYIAQLYSNALETGVPVIPVHELRVRDDGLYHGARRIDAIHRCYPLEHVATDSGGAQFARLVNDGRLTIVNPGSALFLQNKLTLALIWSLYQRNKFFDESHRAAIARFFLPAYTEEPAGGIWVRKPAFGREGNSISIVENGRQRTAPESRTYQTQPMLYQQYAPSQKRPIRLSDGSSNEAFATVTCMIAGGFPGAIGMRLGDEIIDGWAHFQPLAYP